MFPFPQSALLLQRMEEAQAAEEQAGEHLRRASGSGENCLVFIFVVFFT